MDNSRDQVVVGPRRMPRLERPLITILERSLVADASRAQAQVAEQYEKIQALSLCRGKDLMLDLVPAGPDRLRLRRVEKQLVFRPRNPPELLVQVPKTLTLQLNLQ